MRRKVLAGAAVVVASIVAGAVPASADHTAGSSGGTCFAGPFSGTGIPVDISTPWMHEHTRRDGRTLLFCVFLGLPASVDADDPANAPGVDYTAPTRAVRQDGVLCMRGDFEIGDGTFLNLPGGVALLACEWPAPADWEPPRWSHPWSFGRPGGR